MVCFFNIFFDDRKIAFILVMEIPVPFVDHPRRQKVLFTLFQAFFLFLLADMQKKFQDNGPIVGKLAFKLVDLRQGSFYSLFPPDSGNYLGK